MKRNLVVIGVIVAALLALGVGGMWAVNAFMGARDSAIACTEEFLARLGAGEDPDTIRQLMTARLAQNWTPTSSPSEPDGSGELGAFRSLQVTTWRVFASAHTGTGRSTTAQLSGYADFENGRRGVMLELLDQGQGWRVDKFTVNVGSP
jgi:hypothetical protein